jgi:leader peptidase (prepilin peptidase)/N-methyltransferase
MGTYVEIAAAAASFFVGAFAGNFYELIVHRLPGGRFRVLLPPACPACGRAERRIWMLPLLWYILLRGRCLGCGYRYRRRLVAWEAAGGLVATLLFYYYGFSLALATTFAFCFFFFLNFWVDFRYGALVPQLYFPGLGAGLAVSFLPGPPTPTSAAAGALLGGGLLLAARPGRALFSEDRWGTERQLAMVALAGAFLGWQSALFVLAVAAAAVLFASLVGRRLFGSRPENAFGPAVLVATLALVFYRADITSWYFRVR